MTQDQYYALAPGVEVVGLPKQRLLLRSDSVSLTLEGAGAAFLQGRVLPLLDGSRRLADLVAELPEVAPEALVARLKELTDSRILRTTVEPTVGSRGAALADPLQALLEALGVSDARAQRLRSVHIAVFGLETCGAWIADGLVRLGVGRLTLVDPFPCDPASWRLLPHTESLAAGVPRQDWLRGELSKFGSATELHVGPERALDKADVLAQAADAHLLIGCFDRAFSAAHHWINVASFERGIPAVYCDVRGHRVVVGPMVFPHETPCYLCWRMRSVACADDFDEEMAHEQHLDRLRRPAGAQRPVLPALLPYATGLVVTEIVKILCAVGTPALTAKILEFDALSGRTTSHSVVFRPDCPVCKKKTRRRLSLR